MKKNVDNNIKKMAKAIIAELHNGVTMSKADSVEYKIESMLRNLANQAYTLGKVSK